MATINVTSLNTGNGIVQVTTEVINTKELAQVPKKFDGTKPRPQKWLEDYKDAKQANGWNNRVAVKYFSTYLKKSALDWYKTMVLPTLVNKPIDIHYEWVLKKFSDHYIGEQDKGELQYLIDNMKQRENESITLFLPKMCRLLRQLNETMAEREIVRRIRSKLRDEYRLWLAKEKPQTVEDLRNHCLDIEAGLPKCHDEDDDRDDDYEENETSESSNEDDTDKTEEDDEEEEYCEYKGGDDIDQQDQVDPDDEEDEDCGNQPPQRSRNPSRRNRSSRSFNRNNGTRECFICYRTNHIARNCFATTRRDGTPINSSRNSQQPNNDHQDRVNLVIGGGKLLQLAVMCNSKKINAICDTGANVSVINEETVIENKWQIIKLEKDLIGVNRLQLHTIGITLMNIEVKIGDTMKCIQHLCTVVKNLTTKMIIGLDLMQALKICVDIVDMNLSFKEESRAIFKTKVQTTNLTITKPFELDQELIVANYLSDTVKNTTQTAVIKTGDKPNKIASDTHVIPFKKSYQIKPWKTALSMIIISMVTLNTIAIESASYNAKQIVPSSTHNLDNLDTEDFDEWYSHCELFYSECRVDVKLPELDLNPACVKDSPEILTLPNAKTLE